MKPVVYLVFLMVLSLLLSSCTPTIPFTQPCISTADWIDFLQLNGVQYLRYYENDGILTEEDRGGQFATIKYMNSGGCREGPIRDGDAAYLPIGTKIYTVKGYDSRFRLAAFRDGELLLFDLDSNENARNGADLLDLQGKVATIEVLEIGTVRLLATIEDSNTVNSLVEMVLTANADPAAFPSSEPDYIITFHMRDGTRVSRAYDEDTPILWRDIYVDPQFTEIIQEAVEK